MKERLIHPLDWFLQERSLLDPYSGLLTLTSTTVQAEQALEEATRLKREFDTPISASQVPFQACVYLSRDMSSTNVPIVFDTGASFSLTPFKDDFVGPIESSSDNDIHGINGSSKIDGEGWVEWTIRDLYDNVCLVRTRAYYVPDSHIRLFSPQAYCKLHGDGPYGYFDHAKLEFQVADGQKMTFPYTDGNLPLMLLDRDVLQAGVTADIKTNCHNASLLEEVQSILSHRNHNLDGPHKELSLIHQRLAHAGVGWLQDLMHKQKGPVGSPADEPIIPTRFPSTKYIKFKPDHHCAACLMAKQHRRGAKSSKVIAIPEKNMAIRRNATAPGDMVSMDQWVSRTPGRLLHSRGKEPASRRYHGGTIYYDHFSGYIHIECQVSLRSGETIQGKHRFQKFGDRHGVKLRHFRSDNHPFGSQAFQDDLELFDQTISHSGVGAHHQAGVAERAIQTVTYWARAIMMQQLLHWPAEFRAELWAFALEHAVYVWNHLPRSRNGLAPIELFTGVKSTSSHPTLMNLRVWGCPAWVLDPKLQDGHKLPKFQARSRCGMYVGNSTKHSDSVGRILSLRTGHVSPQFHVVYDEKFSTAIGTVDRDRVLDEKMFSELIQFDGYSSYLDKEDTSNPRVQQIVQDLYDGFNQDSPPRTPVSEGDDHFSPQEPQDEDETSVSEGATKPYKTRFGREIKKPAYATIQDTKKSKQKSNHSPHAAACYAAGGKGRQKVRCSELNNQFLSGLDWDPSSFLSGNSVDTKRVLARLLQNFDDSQWEPLALAAKSNSLDTYTYQEAMNGPNRDGFMDSARIEIDTLVRMGVWDVVDREYWMNVLPSTWTFRVKRFTDGTIRKLKGRFCARGDRQIENVDFFDTWAPVVSWNTVRLMLVLTAIMGLHSRQVDYTAAFVHADIDKPPNWNQMTEDERQKWGVYVEMPQGFQQEGKVLKLNKSLYGLRQSPRLWVNFLKTNLEAIGFKQAVDVDACLFISDDVIIISYVDDSILFSKSQEAIDDVIDKLQNQRNMQLEVEDDAAGFLGVKINRNNETGEVELTQTGLIDRIISGLGCDDLEPADTPAIDTLGKDEFGDPATGDFNYGSIMGMIWYLERHSRPDLGFAASQCARFTFNPKRSHELAMIRIGQYLKKTRDKGIIYKPFDSTKLELEAHVDADFMGIYGKEQRSDPDNVKSRTGYVISLNGCPMIWGSKLQESISLSTMMSEYYALSHCMREVLPFRDLIKVVADGVGLDKDCVTNFKTTVWEDNNGCLHLANMDPGQHTPRSKFYDCKVHWFRSHLKSSIDTPTPITVLKIDTRDQLGDIFTKPLPLPTFEYLRKKMMGW